VRRDERDDYELPGHAFERARRFTNGWMREALEAALERCHGYDTGNGCREVLRKMLAELEDHHAT
jgi:hypothetical protein